jgi:hypothetical protein
MHGHSTVLNELIVSDLQDENSIVMPKTYTRDRIPVDRQQIPTPEVVTEPLAASARNS